MFCKQWPVVPVRAMHAQMCLHSCQTHLVDYFRGHVAFESDLAIGLISSLF